MNLYFFDCDKTLYDFNFRKRLPTLAQLTGTTEYHIASTWWTSGHERAAESGKYNTSDEYFTAFTKITGANLTLHTYQESRKAAMTPIQGSIEALRRVATTGIVSLLSNNPIPFRESFSVLAPDAASILGANVLVSAALGARKPEHRLFTRALEKFGAEPHDAILIDDSAINIEGARATGMHAFQLCKINRTFDITGLNQALNNFTARNRQNP